jgi:hypothetical protein
MGLGIAANLPWKDIVLALPGVAQTATELWKKWKSKPDAPPLDRQESPEQQIAAIVERLQALEKSEVAQAGVVKEITEQLQAISTGLSEVSKRSNAALWVGAGAFIMSAATLVFVIVR